MTRFEEIIDNPRIFALILDGFLQDWHGSHDIMVGEDPRARQFKNHESFAEFCHFVRSTPAGESLCIQCDAEYAAKAAEKKEPLVYLCHAGLVDVAVPIIVDGESIATIFCGQVRSEDAAREEQGQLLAQQTEEKLGLPPGQLQDMRARTRQVPEERVEEIKTRLWEVATYVSMLGFQKLEAEKARQQMGYRLRETEAIQQVLAELPVIVEDIREFWRKMDLTLAGICRTIGATCGALVTCERTPRVMKLRTIVRSVAHLSNDFVGRAYPVCSPMLLQALETTAPSAIKLETVIEKGQFLEDILRLFENRCRLDTVALVPLNLAQDLHGIMVFFLTTESDLASGLVVQEEINLLDQVGRQVAAAYETCDLYLRRKAFSELHGQWLENVSHQLLSPLNEILGQAENLSRSFRRWQTEKPERIENILETLMELAFWAARLASNFAWIAKGDEVYKGPIESVLEEDMVGRLIGYARNVQGMAKEQRLTRVHVDRESVLRLNGRVRIDRKLFKQAICNLLDNAVKYSNSGCEVVVHASLTDCEAMIHITNHGIPIRSDEVERIFEREYRTEAAQEKYAIGTGIGLTIARDLIHLHGGEISVDPSEETSRGWKTTFTVTLPVVANRN